MKLIPLGFHSSRSHTWDFLKALHPKVIWHHLIWFPGNKLSTQDKIWKFTSGPLACVLCYKALESHDHLFVVCDYSSFIWQKIMSRFTMVGSPLDWNSFIGWAASKWKSKKSKDIMPRMCLGATFFLRKRLINKRKKPNGTV